GEEAIGALLLPRAGPFEFAIAARGADLGLVPRHPRGIQARARLRLGEAGVERSRCSCSRGGTPAALLNTFAGLGARATPTGAGWGGLAAAASASARRRAIDSIFRSFHLLNPIRM